MSKKSESEIYEKILQDLGKHGYKVISDHNLQREIDLLARKGNYLFAIEVKDRPIETFDIINSSTISTRLKENLAFKTQNVMAVVITGSAITEEAKILSKETGVIITEPSKLRESLEHVLKASNSRLKASRET